MHETLALFLACVAGGSLGAMFFGGLWWTIRRSVSSTQPALWFLGSMLLRTIIVLVGFYVVSRGRWQPLLLCLVGFAVARLTVTWMIREAHHAPQS